MAGLKFNPVRWSFCFWLLLLACNDQDEEIIQPDMVQLQVLDYETLQPVSGARVQLQECDKKDFILTCVNFNTIQTFYTDQEGMVEFDRRLTRDNIIVQKSNYLTDFGKHEDCRLAPPTPPVKFTRVFLLPQTPLIFLVKGNLKNDSTEWVEIAAYYKGAYDCEFAFLFGGSPLRWDTPQRFQVGKDTVLQRPGLANRSLHLKVKYYVRSEAMPVILTHTRTFQEVYTPAGERTSVQVEL